MTVEQPAVRSGRTIVGIDGSEESQRALRWASFIAKAMRSDVEAVIAWDWGMTTWAPYPSGWNPAADARQIIDKTLDTVFGTHDHPANLKVTVEEGYPARVLLDASAGADMLVVGSRGHGGFAGLLLGSVSAACSEHATCPVLVIHGTTPGPPELDR